MTEVSLATAAVVVVVSTEELVGTEEDVASSVDSEANARFSNARALDCSPAAQPTSIPPAARATANNSNLRSATDIASSTSPSSPSNHSQHTDL